MCLALTVSPRFTISRRSIQTQSRVSAAEGKVSKCSAGLQSRGGGVPFPVGEAGARPGRRLEHVGGAVLEKRRPDRCQELLHRSPATGTPRTLFHFLPVALAETRHPDAYLTNIQVSSLGRPCAFYQSKNKVSLRNLSMVLRQSPAADSDAHAKQVMESVAMAREAVQLDVMDGTTWCE